MTITPVKPSIRKLRERGHGIGHGHIPDYLGIVEQVIDQVVPGGASLSAPDPLGYPCRSRQSTSLDRNAYFLGRLGQSQLRYGLAARLRRVAHLQRSQ
jgi:hypothetical protein